MIPYIFFLLFLLVFYRLKKPVWLTILITVFAVIRYDTGWDYGSYYEAFTDPTAYEVAKNSWGWLWAIWLDFVYQNKIPEVGIGVPAVLTSCFLYHALYKLYYGDKNKISDAILIYSLWPFLYLQSFCIIRQALAITIMFLAYVYLARRRFILSALLYMLNILVHPSSVFCAFFAFFAIPNKRISVKWVIIGSILAVLAFGFAAFVLERLGLLTYLSYLESSDDFGGKISIVYAFLAVFFIRVVAINKDLTSEYAKMTSLVALGCILQFLVYVTNVPSVISRVCSYTYIFLVPTLFYSISQLKIKGGKSLLIGFLVAFFLVYLIITQGADGASSQYVPYKTVFTKL